MSPKELTAFRVDPDIMDGLRRVKDRDGVPISVQLDRALRAWLKKQRVIVKPGLSARQVGRAASRRSPR